MDVVFGDLSMGPMEMIIIGVIAVLLFGKRLPEVGRSLGRGLSEFQKGIRGLKEQISSAAQSSSVSHDSACGPRGEPDEREEATAPKFEPPAGEPKPETVES